MNSRQLFEAAIAGESPERMPVWFMRQAGRLFPEYRKLRKEYDFKELCQSPENNARVTCMPVQKLDVDAAIIFSDILLPLESIGAGFELVPGEGPVLDRTIDSAADVDNLTMGSPRDDLSYVFEAIRSSIDRLPESVPLIGFAGAPFTLASYLVEGGRSRSMMKTRRFMLNEPQAWTEFMNRLVDVTIPYLQGQIEAGAEFLQLFDSWVGQLSPARYRDQVLPHTKRIIDAIDNVPMIHFGTKTAGLLPHIAESGADVISLDWRIDLEKAEGVLGEDTIMQGNFDPGLLLGNFDEIQTQLDNIIEQAPDRGHIFNLGHGILPETEPEIMKSLVRYVKAESG
jgi:uroporphyrinogen decarboxylase